MKIEIEVASEEEGRLIARGLADPVVRATVKVWAIVADIPDRNSQVTVLNLAALELANGSKLTVKKTPPAKPRRKAVR